MFAHTAVQQIIAIVVAIVGAAAAGAAQAQRPSGPPPAPRRAAVPQAARQDDPAGRPPPVSLNASFRHFRYKVDVDRNGARTTGSGEMWMWFGEGNLFLRIMSSINTSQFGSGNITLIINPATQTLYIVEDLSKLHMEQCHKFPDHDSWRAAHLKTRAEQVSQWVSGGYGIGSLRVPWTKSNVLQLRTTPSGEVQGVDLMRGYRVVKSFTVVGEAEVHDWPPDNIHDLFKAPYEDCDAPLEAVGGLTHLSRRRDAHQGSTALNDLLLMMTGPEEHPQTFLTLSAFALPGDMGVMMEDPPPPKFEMHRAIAFTYNSTVFRAGSAFDSKGYVWMDLHHRALWLRGEGAHTLKGPFSMDIFARTDSEAKVYSTVNLTAMNERQCVYYNYPELPVSQAAELNAFSAATLSFVDIGEVQGEECAVFSVPLPRQRELRVWVDMEEDKLSAILKIQVWRKGKCLRSTEVLQWHEALEFNDTLVQGITDGCSGALTSSGLAHLGLKTVHGGYPELQNALYALRFSPINFAVLQLLALPGDVAVALEEDSSSGPHGRTSNKVLNSPYMHFKYRVDSTQANLQHTSKGEMWLWYTEGHMHVRMSARVQSPRYGDGNVTLVLNPNTSTINVFYILEKMHWKDCLEFPFPKLIDTGRIETLFQRSNVINQWASGSGSGRPVESLQMKWTMSKTLNLRLGPRGKVQGLSIKRGSRVVSSFSVEGSVEESDRPPDNIRKLLSLVECSRTSRFRTKTSSSMEHQGSSALNDLLTMMGPAPIHMSQAFLSVVAFTLPGDAAVMLHEPDPPHLDKLRGLSFDYRSTVWKKGVRAESKGSIWIDLKERAFRLMGEAEHTKMGPFLMYLVARAGSNPKVYSDVELAARHEQQCVAYTYPELPKLQADELKGFVAEDLTFKDVGETQGEDCAIFVAPLPRGHELRVWVDLERDDLDTIMRSEVWSLGSPRKILRRTEVLEWHKAQDAVLEALSVPEDRWQCSDDYSSGQLAHLGLHTVHERSSALQDVLFALRRSPLQFAVLQLLALPGDVAVALRQSGGLNTPASENGEEEGDRMGSFVVISLVVIAVLFITFRWEYVKRTWLRQRHAPGPRGPMEDVRNEDESAACLATGPALAAEFGE